MNRLTERGFKFTSNYVAQRLQAFPMAQCLSKLQEYEDAEEQGLLVRLPCKVGDTVFSLWSRVDSKKQYIRSATITAINLMYYLSRVQIGTTFTTRQDAEKALAESEM